MTDDAVSRERMKKLMYRMKAGAFHVPQTPPGEWGADEYNDFHAIIALIEREPGGGGWQADALFIKHIEGHLEPGEEVVCRICGKTAGQVINEEYKPTPEDKD